MGGVDKFGKQVGVGAVERERMDVGRSHAKVEDEHRREKREEEDAREGVGEVSVLVPADGVEREALVCVPASVPGGGDEG